MINKKVIVAIVLFIICGLFIYSFANPLDNSELDEPIDEGSGIVVDDKDKKNNMEDEKELEELEEDKEEEKEEEEQKNQNEQTLIAQNTSQKNYGTGTGNRVPSGSGSNNNGSTGGNNSGNTNNNQNTENTPPPAPIVKKSGTKFTRIGYLNENSEIGMRQTGNTIEYGGRTDSNLIKIKIESTDTFNNDEIKNAKVTVSSPAAGMNNLTDRIAIDTATNHAYVEFEYAYQKINDGNFDELGPTNYDQLTVTIDWGYGIKETYTLILKIERL